MHGIFTLTRCKTLENELEVHFFCTGERNFDSSVPVQLSHSPAVWKGEEPLHVPDKIRFLWQIIESARLGTPSCA